MSKHSFWKLHRPTNTMPLKVKPILLWLLLIALLAAGCSSNKSYRADRFDVDLALQPENVLLVTETVQFRFQGGPFTYAYRDLARDGLDAIDQIEADMDGAPLPRGNNAGEVEIKDGDSLRITWHFAPVHDSTHTFTLRYRVLGAVRQEEGADVLRWYAIPPEHGYPITEAIFRLRPPADVTPLAAPRVLDGGQFRDTGDGLLSITGEDIGDDDAVIVEARFPANILLSAAPAWQVQQRQRSRQAQLGLPGALTTFFAVLMLAGGLLLRQMQRLRGPKPHRGDSIEQSTPPSTAPPAIGLTLARRGIPALAAVFDLAQRGAVGIEEAGKRWGARQFVLRQQNVAAARLPHEQGLLEALFTTRQGRSDSAPLDQLASRLARQRKLLETPLDNEMELAGWLDQARKAGLRRLALRWGLVMGAGQLAVIGGIIGLTLADNHHRWTDFTAAMALIAAGIALFLPGLVGLIAFAGASPLTEQGSREGERWRRFGNYLERVAADKADLPDNALFARYLPYAAGFGLGEKWAKRYQRATGFEIPAWFHLLGNDDSATAFVAVMTASHASFHSSSGGAAGGGGASGGGGSGAG